MVCVCARLYLISSDVVVTVFFYRLSLPDYKFFILRLDARGLSNAELQVALCDDCNAACNSTFDSPPTFLKRCAEFSRLHHFALVERETP